VPDKPREIPGQPGKVAVRREWGVSFAEMFKGRLRQFKLFTEDQIEARWQAYLVKNPGLARLQTRGEGD